MVIVNYYCFIIIEIQMNNQSHYVNSDNYPSQQYFHNIIILYHRQKQGKIVQLSWVVIDTIKHYYFESNIYRISDIQNEFTNQYLLEAILMCIFDLFHSIQKAFKSVILMIFKKKLLEEILPREMAKKGYPLPHIFYSFIDLETEFKECYGKRAQDLNSIQQMALYIGEYSNREPIISLAIITVNLLNKNYVLKNIIYVDRVNNKLLYPQVSSAVLQKESKEVQMSYFKLRGVPFRITKKQIITFLKVPILKEEDVEFIYKGNKFDGVVLVRIPKIFDDVVIDKHKKYLDKRYIEVMGIRSEQFYLIKNQNIESRITANHNDESVKILRKERSRSRSNSIKDTRITKKNYKEYSDKNYHRKKNSDEINSNSSSVNYEQNSTQHRFVDNQIDKLGIIKMRGLPYSCSDTQIYQFFEGYRPIKKSIKYLTRDNKKTGQALILFKSRRQASQSLVLDRKKIGNRYIQLSKCDPDEYNKY